MTGLPSIRRRITTALIVGALVWGLAVTAVVSGLVMRAVDDLLDGALQESAEVLFGLLTLNTNTEALPLQRGGAMPAPAHEERLVWQLIGPDQQVLLRSHRAPLQALLSQHQAGFSDAGLGWRVYGMPLAQGQRILYVGQPVADRNKDRLTVAAMATLSTLLVGGLFALWLRGRARSELQTLQQLSSDVSHYDPLTRSTRLAPVQRAELLPIHLAITELGQRLARRVANERAFTAHAAHALRTPLAGMDAQLALALRECSPDIRPRLERTRQAANRLSRVVSALLTLFRSGVDLQWQVVDLKDLLQRVPVDSLAVDIRPGSVVVADPDLLAAALINLLDNSVRHGASSVTVRVDDSAGGQTITVQDDGPGVGPERRSSLQQALDTQDYEDQTGLGLMLADLVARAHGGQLRLMSPASGFEVAMRLGRAPLPVSA
jgi:signal transduction histidine kinase